LVVYIIYISDARSDKYQIYWSLKQDVCLTALHYIEKLSYVSNAGFDILHSAVDYSQQPHRSMRNSVV
jgi:hypothetical protein